MFTFVFLARDKSERAFGVAFVKLMNPDGTTLRDGRHDLVVYKVQLVEQGSENYWGNIYCLWTWFRIMCISIGNFSRARSVCPFKSRKQEDSAHSSYVVSPIPFLEGVLHIIISPLEDTSPCPANGVVWPWTVKGCLPPLPCIVLCGTVTLLGLVRIWWVWEDVVSISLRAKHHFSVRGPRFLPQQCGPHSLTATELSLLLRF